MDKDTHVYCKQCQNFKCNMIMLEDEYTINLDCKYKDECDFYDTEDSKPFSERPFYKSNFWFNSL
jgi:hypothetical protein